MPLEVRRRISRRRDYPEANELNLVPFMDMLISLIPFLMISAVFATVSVVETNAPARQSTKSAQESSLVVLMITDNGYSVGGSGPIMKGASGSVVVPKKSGHYDVAGLIERLVILKKNDEEAEDLLIIADSETPYSDLIDAMDAARNTPDGEFLFPNAFFGGTT